MGITQKKVLLISMPFAGPAIPAIQLPILKRYLEKKGCPIRTRHLYLKAAEFYGIMNYNFLIYPPNDCYNAQMVFSKYVFPKHWKKIEEHCREHFNRIISNNKVIKRNFNFDDYIRYTSNFYNWVIEKVDWKSYDLIGFTLNFGQFLPSLAIAKKIKELKPKKEIIFGGSRTVDAIGINVLKTFDYVDFIVSGDGEDALYLLASNQDHASIPHLIYRKGKDIIWNKSDAFVDLNNLPMLSFEPFFEELSSVSDEVRQYFSLYGKLPIEISRGCWWNKCTFCNLNVQHKIYREKAIDRIIEEIKYLSDKYNMLAYQLIGNTLPKKNYKELLMKIKELGRDFTFFVEARAGQLKSEDYTLLKEAGFSTIQTGIETFSRNYIKKMNKGVRVIDNIATLKFCKENEIINEYNLIVNYPNEEPTDFEETKKVIQLFKQYLNPPHISPLIVEFGSPIYRNPEKFNIETLECTMIDKIMFPEEVLKQGCNFIYSFKRKKDVGENNWEKLIEDWKKEYEQQIAEGIKSQTAVDKFVFFFFDGGSFLKIYDKRDKENIRIYILDEIERDILLSCIDVISYEELSRMHSHIPDYQLAAILHTFEEKGIVFHEDNLYLCLPLQYSKIINKNKQPPRKLEQVIYNSGNHLLI